ncbi:MAG TPA: GAF domain-containing protein [Planctomycetes bacterium]|nr:GAF domain-containing protein [Planctomycetota bacterium]
MAKDGKTREGRLLEAIREVTEGRSLQETLARLLSEALAGVGGELGWIAVVESEGMRVKAVQGASALSPGSLIPFGKGLTGAAYAAGRPYYAPDVSLEKHYWKVSGEVRSEYLVPLTASGETIGILNVESGRVDGFSEDDREYVAALAGLASNAVALARRFEDVSGDLETATLSLAERVHALEAMSEAVRAISGSLDLDTVIRIIIERARDVLGADEAHLLLRGEDGGFALHTSTSLSRGAEVNIEQGVTGWVVRNRKPLCVPDVSLDERYVTWREGTRSELAVPLMDAGELTGVLNFESSRLGAFSAFHEELAETFAGHVAVALKNAALFTGLENARRDLALTEGLRVASEVAADIIHYVGNKAGALPQTLRLLADMLRGRLPADDENLALNLIDLAVKASGEILSIKADVLDTAKPLNPEPVEVAPLVREAASELGGVNVSLNGMSDVKVLGDRHALLRLFANAFDNAMKALAGTPQPRIHISWKQSGGEVDVEIRDNGRGFPEDLLAGGLIPRFGKSGGSSGMGLWLSERIAARMGGRLFIGNVSGGGAYVRVRLPAVTCDSQR